jgi:DNA ligase-associated metallophosphoesterase
MIPDSPSAHSIVLAGETLRLLPERAVHWPGEDTLFLADPHFGKAASFRALGVAAPDTTDADLARLTLLLARTRPRRLVVLGDFFHARSAQSPAVLAALRDWRRLHAALEVDLVLGNHDRHAGAPPSDLAIQCAQTALKIGPFLGRHEPGSPPPGCPTLCGHLHPGVRLRERNGAGLRLPCFVLEGAQLVLPAFGGFTGLALQTAGPDRFLFAVTDAAVLPLPAPARPRH